MVLCQCTGVTDATIESLIADGAVSVREITQRCGAGQHCACCRAEIAAMLPCGGTADDQRPVRSEPRTDEPDRDPALQGQSVFAYCETLSPTLGPASHVTAHETAAIAPGERSGT